MNLLEAIQGAGENWIRPKANWTGCAYEIDKHGSLIFKTQGGDHWEFVSSIELLTGKWEIVTPEQVLAERKS